MIDTVTTTGSEIAVTRHAFAWVVRSAGEGPIAVPLRDLSQAQWDQLVQRLGRDTRRRMRVALEGMT